MELTKSKLREHLLNHAIENLQAVMDAHKRVRSHDDMLSLQVERTEVNRSYGSFMEDFILLCDFNLLNGNQRTHIDKLLPNNSNLIKYLKSIHSIKV